MRRVVACLLLAFATLLAPTGRPLAQTARKTRSVGVLPVRNLATPCAQIFVSGAVERVPASKLASAIEDSLRFQYDVRTVPFLVLRNQVAGAAAYKDKLVVGRERYLMGKELYADLRQAEAEESLRRGIELLESVYYDLVEPDAFSEILLLLGVTLVEEEKSSQALAVFKRALLLHPHLRLPAGYYPKPVEEAIILACEDVRQSLEREIPLAGADRTMDLMERHGLDAMFFPLLTASGERQTLTLIGFERNQISVAFREEIPVESDAAAAQRIDEAISRWVGCTPFRKVKPSVEEAHSFMLSAAYQHMVLLVAPTRSMVQSMGFSFESGYFFMPSFALVGRLQFLSSIPDRFEDMFDGFTSARAILGPAFSISGTWWRLYLVPAAELHYMGSYSLTTDSDCKYFAAGSPGYKENCDTSRITESPVQYLGGVNVHLGSQFFFSNQLFLSAGVSVATYFMPFDRSIDTNFPLAAEIGGGVAF